MKNKLFIPILLVLFLYSCNTPPMPVNDLSVYTGGIVEYNFGIGGKECLQHLSLSEDGHFTLTWTVMEDFQKVEIIGSYLQDDGGIQLEGHGGSTLPGMESDVHFQALLHPQRDSLTGDYSLYFDNPLWPIEMDHGVLVLMARSQRNRGIRNGDFSSNRNPWGVWDSEGRASFTVNDEVLHVSIDDPDNPPWSAGMAYSPIRVEENRIYKLTFTAWTNQEGTISVSLGQRKSPWTLYGKDYRVELSKEPEIHTLYFDSGSHNDPFGRISVNFGGNQCDIFLDNFSLEVY